MVLVGIASAAKAATWPIVAKLTVETIDSGDALDMRVASIEATHARGGNILQARQCILVDASCKAVQTWM